MVIIVRHCIHSTRKITNSDAPEPKVTHMLATYNMAAMDESNTEADATAYKLAYFDKSGDENVPVSYDFQVLLDYDKNDAEAKQDLKLVEEKTDFKTHNYSAMVRPSRSELRKHMRRAVTDYRQLSVADVSMFEFQQELQLFWNALERKTMHHMVYYSINYYFVLVLLVIEERALKIVHSNS